MAPTRRYSGSQIVLILATLPIVACPDRVMGQGSTPPHLAEPTAVTLQRTYQPGETLTYEMKGSNRGWEYQIQASVQQRKNADGVVYDEIGWSNLRSNAPMELSSASLAFRQNLSTESATYFAIPDLSKVQPFLIGPMMDMLTFYSDLFLVKQFKLTQVSQHGYFEHAQPNSWADGQRVIVGQDSIDFDMTLVDYDAQQHVATVLIRHVPPLHPQMHLPAKWMESPIGHATNNWVEVDKAGDKYIAQVGEEVFDVHIKVDTRDGKIISAQMHNPVTAVSRECEDAALLQCADAKPDNILREVSLTLKP